jgi:DNA polymerase-3 subunit alpha
MARSMVHLHTHTEMSLFDGLGKQEAFVKRAKKMGHPAVGFTEHGTMRGILKQRAACADSELKAIYGIEFYICDDMTRGGLSPDEVAQVWAQAQEGGAKGLAAKNEAVYQEEVRRGIRARNHLTVLAKTDEGLRNLFRLSSMAWIQGNYKKPRIDWRTLREHRAGLVVLSGCLSGPLSVPILAGDFGAALQKAEEMLEWFGEDFYLEIMPHSLPEQVQVNKALVRISDAMGIPLVATQDAHFVNACDHDAQSALLCVHTKDVLSNPDRFKFDTDEFYLKGRAEMEASFREHHGYMKASEIKASLDTTLEINEKITAQLKTDKFAAILPPVKLRDGFTDEFRFLSHLCLQGWERRKIDRRAGAAAAASGRSEEAVREEYTARLKLELKDIRERKFVRYFLIIEDMYHFARQRGIGIGPGRGSAAGSFVAYLIGLVDLDPLEHGLLFERFMAPGRIDLPDIDCDFESRRRGEILAYLRDAYGADKTAQIATVNEMKGKDCINSVGRVLEIPIGKLRAISATIEARKKGDADVHATIVDAFQENQVCKDFDTEYPQFLPLATKLEGTAKVLGVHAAGVVVTPMPVMDICPLETREGDEGPVVVTAVDMNGAAELGLVKIDVLAVKNVDMVEDCVRMVRERHGTEIDFAEIDYNDPAVIEKFTAGLFAGIFQFDTASAQKLCNGVQFERFEDITALNALNRPGTMQSGLAAEWIKRKADPEARVSIHPVVDEACADTLGVIAYQEHVMRILRAVGFTPEETDALRKKISKSFGRETLAKEAERFVEMATARGWDRDLAEKVIDQISAFGGYGFNKSHAASYATTSYRQMWLKTYYPVEYMWSLLTNEDQMTKMARLVKEARKMGIAVRPPLVNDADTKWVITEAGEIVGALSDLKGIGPAAIEAIKAHRPFKHFVDFAKRVERRKVNKKVVEVLLKAGAMAELVPNQKWALENLERLWGLAGGGKWSELAQTLVAFADEPDWTEEEAASNALAVNPMAAEGSIELHRDFLESLPVEWASTADEGFWDRSHAFMVGTIMEVKTGRGDKSKSGPAQYAYVTLEALRRRPEGDAAPTEDEGAGEHEERLRFDGEALEMCGPYLKKGALIAVHVGVNTKYKNTRVHYLVDVLELKRKLELLQEGQDTQFSRFELMLTEHNPVAQHTRRDLLEVLDGARQGTVVGLVTHVFRKLDKKKNEMAFFGLQGKSGFVECLAFSSTWQKHGEGIVPGALIRADLRRDRDGGAFLFDRVSDFFD